MLRCRMHMRVSAEPMSLVAPGGKRRDGDGPVWAPGRGQDGGGRRFPRLNPLNEWMDGPSIINSATRVAANSPLICPPNDGWDAFTLKPKDGHAVALLQTPGPGGQQRSHPAGRGVSAPKAPSGVPQGSQGFRRAPGTALSPHTQGIP